MFEAASSVAESITIFGGSATRTFTFAGTSPVTAVTVREDLIFETIFDNESPVEEPTPAADFEDSPISDTD